MTKLTMIERALDKYDAITATCPARKKFLGEMPCPACKAGPQDGCNLDIRASDDFIATVRTLISTLRNNGGQ